jgi:glycosyltransferase involved in cell wall biosynthesis
VPYVVARLRDVTGVDAALRKVSRPGLPPLTPEPADAIRVLLYAPSDLNQMDGSAIWVESAVRTLLVDPRVRVTVPLRSPVRRDVITGPLRRLPRVELVDIHPRLAPRRLGLTTTQAIDLIERLDRRRPFDAVVIRSFQPALEAASRPSLAGRLWSCYILEPERDPDDPVYRTDMTRIAEASRHVAVQSPGMRDLLESLVPAARGRTILLPPAVPPEPVARVDPDRPVRRMLYTGKFHPFYPVDAMLDLLIGLRSELPDLEFHVAGDKIVRLPDDPAYAPRMEARLRETPGVVWHGALPREAVARLLAEGGVALSLWDYRHGSRMNDLVVSTKLLDFAAVGLPVVLTPTSVQRALLGEDYPLFADDPSDARDLVRRALTDPSVYAQAGRRTFEASRAYTYPAVHAGIGSALEAAAAERLGASARPATARSAGA